MWRREAKKQSVPKLRMSGAVFFTAMPTWENDIPGLQVSDTDIYGESVVTIDLDGDTVTPDQVHQASLVIKTNGRDMEVPIYINHGILRLLLSVVISGVLMAVLAFSTRLIVTQLPYTVWAGTLIFGIGIYAHWLLVVTKSFSWQRFLMPIMPIKNFFRSQDRRKSVEVLVRIGKFVWKAIKWVVSYYVKFTKYCFRVLGVSPLKRSIPITMTSGADI